MGLKLMVLRASSCTAFNAIRQGYHGVIRQPDFDQMVMFTQISGVFLLFGKVTSGGENSGLSQKAI